MEHQSPYSNENKRHPLFSIWHGIVSRCERECCPEYPKYGGLGIGFHKEWRNDIHAFADYLGPRPSPKHSVDRYPNRDGNYEPGNVRWATPKQQRGNRRKFKEKEAQLLGEIPDENRSALQALLGMLSAAEIAKILDISRQAVTKWEEVPIRTVRRLSRVTGIPPERLHPSPYY